MRGYDACTLSGTLVHVNHDAFFGHPFIGRLPHGVPPTLIHRRDDRLRYPELPRTEDTRYVALWRKKRYARLPLSESYLYLRYFHGRNTWELGHFLRRIRNTPKDFVLYAWHKYLRGDLFGHDRFQLSPSMQEAFARYLEDSDRFDLFADHPVPIQAGL
jgi:hypothetical protein